jgi:endonuclease/exonuclease/phosphatase family metal-dependent hydrolase
VIRRARSAVVAAWAVALIAGGCGGPSDAPPVPPSAGAAVGSCADEHPAVRRYDDALATVTIASFNVDRTGRPRAIAADVRRLLGRTDVDVVGWQEADTVAFARAAASARGWETRILDVGDGSRQVPISWRAARWSLVSSTAHAMTGGAGRDRTDHPFRPKWATEVVLRHRGTGRLLTVLDTHVANHIETGDRWEDNVNARAARQHYRRLAGILGAPGDVRVATGDFQWDHHDDSRARPRGGITRTFAGRARNSYEELGVAGVCPTRNTRWIDYVWLDRPSLAARRAGFVTHRSLGGYASDHRPLLATIALRPG